MARPSSVLAAGPIIQAAGIPFITAGATSPKLPDQVGDMMFLACFGDNVQAAAGAEYAFKNFGKTAYLSSGLDESDAAEEPICGLLTSFDTAQIRSLGAALGRNIWPGHWRNDDE